MRIKPIQTWLLASLLCGVGCSTNRQILKQTAKDNTVYRVAAATQPTVNAESTELAGRPPAVASQTTVTEQTDSPFRTVSYTVQTAPTIDISETGYDASSNMPTDPLAAPPQDSVNDANTLPIDLPQALSMVSAGHPIVGFARWRVQEAYAQWNQAQVLWLPTIQSGFSFHKHDGNYQASNGAIVDVDRNSFQYGLGMGAAGAGTTPRPGVVAQFNLADAYYQPQIAARNAWARSHAADGVVNQQLLTVATAYLELLSSEQDLQILRETRARTDEVTKLTVDFAEAGEGLEADADRLRTELALVDTRVVAARERSAVAAARMAQALSLDSYQRIVPSDPTVVPFELTTVDQNAGSLIATGLGHRPELKEAQALVSVACEQYQRQQYAPFIPSVLLGFSTGGFGGGVGNDLANVANRYDLDALATWQVRNLGFGERYARREASARVQQAKFEQVRLLDQVAFEITEAHQQVTHRRERVAIAQLAIESAQKSFDRNLSRIRDGHGLPLEVLQSVQALEQARRGYLNAVVDFNQAQFRLQWALGWPVRA